MLIIDDYNMDMKKEKELLRIAQEIDSCAQCHIGTTGKAVAGEGNPNAEIIFVGEAPGRQEALTGRPFIGRSGQLLRSLIREIGLIEDDIFITSAVKYLPVQGTPSKKQIYHGRKHLFGQLDIIQPQFIVLLGKVAAWAIFNEDIPIAKRHGDIVEKDGRKFVVEYHPAAALRFPPLKKIFMEDFKKLRSILE